MMAIVVRLVFYPVVLFLLLLAVRRVTRARRLRRLGAPVTCSHCDYPLVDAEVERCSECGRSKSRSAAYRSTRGRIRRCRLTAALLVLLAIATTLTGERLAARGMEAVPTVILIESIGRVSPAWAQPELSERDLTDTQWSRVYERSLPLVPPLSISDGQLTDGEAAAVELAARSVRVVPPTGLKRLQATLEGEEVLQGLRIAVATVEGSRLNEAWPAMIRIIEPLVDHPDPETRTHARGVLLLMVRQVDDHLDLLGELVEHADPATRRFGLDTLTQLRRRSYGNGYNDPGFEISYEVGSQIVRWLERLMDDANAGIRAAALIEKSRAAPAFGLITVLESLRLPEFLRDPETRWAAFEVTSVVATLRPETCAALCEIAEQLSDDWVEAARVLQCGCPEAPGLTPLIEKLLRSPQADKRRFGRSLAMSGSPSLFAELHDGVVESLALEDNAPDGIDLDLHVLIEGYRQKYGVPSVVLTAQGRGSQHHRSDLPLLVRATGFAAFDSSLDARTPALHWVPVDELVLPLVSAFAVAIFDEAERNGGTFDYACGLSVGSGRHGGVSSDLTLASIWERGVHPGLAEAKLADLLFGRVLLRSLDESEGEFDGDDEIQIALNAPPAESGGDPAITMQVVAGSMWHGFYVPPLIYLSQSPIGSGAPMMDGVGHERDGDDWTRTRIMGHGVRDDIALNNPHVVVRPAYFIPIAAWVAWVIDPAQPPLGWEIQGDGDALTIRAGSAERGFTSLIVRDVGSDWILTLHVNASSPDLLPGLHELADAAMVHLRRTDAASIRPEEQVWPELSWGNPDRDEFLELLPWAVGGKHAPARDGELEEASP